MPIHVTDFYIPSKFTGDIIDESVESSTPILVELHAYKENTSGVQDK